MDEIDERVAALLKSPLGCAFLIIAQESGLTPEQIAQPDIALDLGAFAAREMTVWRADHIHESEAVLQRGPKHTDLARAILREPAADWWFGPLDIARQVWVPREGQPPGEAQLATPVQPPSQAQLAIPIQPPPSFERYAQKLAWGFCTSTLIQETSSMFAAIDCGVGDIREVYSLPPYAFWQMTVDVSARIFEIDGPQSWHDLCVSYPTQGEISRLTPDFSGDTGRLVPDWFAVAADWDAVHLTFGGWLTAEQVRVDSPAGWTYHWAWDYEQTMWLRWMFTSSDRMPDHQEPDESGPDWRSLYYIIPHDDSSRGHTAPLRRSSVSQTGGDATAGQRAAVIAGLLGLIPALGLGVLSFFNQGRPEAMEQLAGNVVFVLILTSPYLLALVAARTINPAKRGGLLLVLGILSLATVFSGLSGVTVILLPATAALFIAAVRSLRSAGGQVVWAPLFLIPGLLGAAAIGFGFYALFGLQADEPRCWALTVVEGKEEWHALTVPTPSETGRFTMGPFGPEVRRSICTSDIVTGREAAMGLGSAGIGILLMIAVSRLPLPRKSGTK